MRNNISIPNIGKEKSLRNFSLFLALLIAGNFAYAFEANDSILKGKIIDTVRCKANTLYSYALYLPSNYDETNPCPAIFIFDPGANGKSEALLFKDAAEKYGYALVCSNNSRNGPWDDIKKSVDFTMKDAFARFNFDTNRIYTAGFSGGSRTASWVALSTQKIAGVIGYGAGLPSLDQYIPSQVKGFDYIGLIGKKDFNYEEMLEMEKRLEKSGLHVRLLISDLKHQLPSQQSILEAVEWMQLGAMKKGILMKDSGFIQLNFKKRDDSISKIEKNGNIFETASNIKYLTNDFSGLTDVSGYQEKYANIIKTKAYSEYLNDMQKAFQYEKEEFAAYRATLKEIRQNNGFSDSLYYWCLSKIISFEKQVKKGDKLKQDMAARILGNIFMFQYEMGDGFYQSKQYPLAIKCYKLCVEAMPDNKYVHYQLACALALNQNYLVSCKTLEKLLELGFKNKKALELEPAFANMKENKRFIEILNGMKEQEQ
jgi:hypothetical protein